MKRRRTRGLRTANDIAERFRDEFGKEAIAVVGLRAEAARQGGDGDDVALWNEVARRLMAGAEEVRDGGGPALWWLMQRVEYYRHQASEAERKAAKAPTQDLRDDLTDLAMRWRELALQADLLAKRAETASRPDEAGGRGRRNTRKPPRRD